MDYRVRIMVLILWEVFQCEGLGLLTTENLIENQAHKQLESAVTHVQRATETAETFTMGDISVEKSLLTNSSESDEKIRKPITILPNSTTEIQTSSSQLKSILETEAPNELAVPEFEDRNEQDEGGKGEEDPDVGANELKPEPPQENAEIGEGVAKEDTEPANEKENMTQQVEDAKGNVSAPKKIQPKIKPQIDFNQSEDSHFMTFLIVGGLLVFCLYLLQHNKKKIIGLILEGRSGARRNVRYRRLSQKDDPEAFREDVIY